MVAAKARIRVRDDYEAIVPVLLPELDEVRRFAAKLSTQSGLIPP
jgi:hypothetical protein